MGWNQVRWTEATQVAELMDIGEEALPALGVAPAEHFRQLRAVDRYGAIDFLGHALPRAEALAWAARVVEGAAADREVKRADRQALDHCLRWLGEPSDATRRAAMDAGTQAGERSPERMLATAVFFSGGSIADPEHPPIQPAPALAGRFAAAAVAMAAARVQDRNAFLDKALDLGDRIAADGTRALEAG